MSTVDVARVFTHHVSLADGAAVAAAYETFARRRDGCVKVALLPGAQPRHISSEAQQL